MDVLWFLRRRTSFVRRFYERAAEQFLETKRHIERGDAPYDRPPSDDSSESPFLEEWQDADEAVEFLGQACVSFLSASVVLYLKEAEREFRMQWGDLFEFPNVTIGADGMVAAYDDWFREFGIDFKRSGRDIQLIREIVITRHLTQHPKSIGLMHLSQTDNNREKFPQPFFGHPVERMVFGKASEHDIPWMLSITPEAFSSAVSEVEEFCTWLEYEWRSGPRALPTSLRSPGQLVGEVIKYFRKPQVAGIRLTGDIAVGQKVRIISRGKVDFVQQIGSMQLDGADIQTATSGSEIGLKVDHRASEGAQVYRLSEG